MNTAVLQHAASLLLLFHKVNQYRCQTYYMQQSPSWEANRSSASQEIHRINNSLPPVRILSQINPVHAPHLTSQRSTLLLSSHSHLGPNPRDARPRRRFATSDLLEIRVRILPRLWKSVCCECRVFSGEVSTSGWSLIQRSSTECGVSECDGEASTMRMTWPTRGFCSMKKAYV